MNRRAVDDTSDSDGAARDEPAGGDPACWAHLGDATAASPLGSVPWEAFAHRLADAVLVADRDGTITYWNAAAERIFGWSAAEATGRGLDLIIPEKHRQRHDDGYRNTVRTGTTRYADSLLEVPALHRDGRRISIAFTVTLLCDDAGRVDRIAAVVRDETERREERLRLQREAAGPPVSP